MNILFRLFHSVLEKVKSNKYLKMNSEKNVLTVLFQVEKKNISIIFPLRLAIYSYINLGLNLNKCYKRWRGRYTFPLFVLSIYSYLNYLLKNCAIFIYSVMCFAQFPFKIVLDIKCYSRDEHKYIKRKVFQK